VPWSACCLGLGPDVTRRNGARSSFRPQNILMDTSKNWAPVLWQIAWAFDLLIDRPVRKECSAISSLAD
jgi:hypothetical protein